MWSSIKDILKDGKTKCVVIEDGKPLYVVLPFEVYQQLQKSENSAIVEENSQKEGSPRLRPPRRDESRPGESEAGADAINGEIQEMTDEGEDEVVLPAVRLEDLPF